MIDHAVKLSTGYIQIHYPGYWENKSINDTFEQSKRIDSHLKSIGNINFIIPRLESFALASSGEHTKGIMIKGTVPEIENELNNFSDKIVRGKYLQSGDRAILIGDELAGYLNVDIGDTIVLLGQGYHGITAAAQYPVKGILKFPIPEFNRQLAVLTLNECQYFFASENRLSSISLMLKDPELLEETFSQIRLGLKDNYEVMTWEQMNKELVQFVNAKVVGGKIMLAILYIVIGFGVFGTVMMMTMERRKEFAILVSIGMRKIKILNIIFWEIFLIGIVAIIIGLIVTYPLVSYLSNNPLQLTGEFAESMKSVGAEPILPFVNKTSIYINQTISIIALTFAAIIYPLLFILKFNVQKAMRH